MARVALELETFEHALARHRFMRVAWPDTAHGERDLRIRFVGACEIQWDAFSGFMHMLVGTEHDSLTVAYGTFARTAAVVDAAITFAKTLKANEQLPEIPDILQRNYA